MGCKAHNRDACTEAECKIKVVTPISTREEVAEVVAQSIKSSAEMQDLRRTVKALEDARLAATSPDITDNGVAGGGSKTKSIMRWETVHRDGSIHPARRAVYERAGGDDLEWVKDLQKSLGTKTPKTWGSSIQRAMNLGSQESAGALVPGEIEQTILTMAFSQSQLMPLATMYPMTQDTLSFPQQILKLDVAGDDENIDGLTFEYLGEGASANEQADLKFRIRQFVAKRCSSFNFISRELLSDAPSFLSMFMQRLASAHGQHWDRQILRGVGGAGRPWGVLFRADETLLNTDRANANEVELNDLLALDEKIHEIFDQPLYIMRKGTQLRLPRNVTQSNPNMVVQYNDISQPLARQPQLNGYPVLRTRAVPALGTKGDVVLLDPKMIGVGLRWGFEISTSTEFRFRTSELTTKSDTRWDVLTLWKEGGVQLNA